MATITTIEQAFRDSKFTQTPGYRQYVHPDAGRVGLRASSVKDFLNNPELLEPAIMMDGIFSMEDVAEADTLYQRLLDELMAVPPQERTPEAEALIDKIIKRLVSCSAMRSCYLHLVVLHWLTRRSTAAWQLSCH